MSDGQRMSISEPLDFAGAVREHRLASEAQHRAENFLAEQSRKAAEAERDYREALARRIVELGSEGVPATVARDRARGDQRVAGLAMKRSVAEGLRDAAQQSIWRFTADRRDLEQFLDWSKRASFLDTQSQGEHR